MNKTVRLLLSMAVQKNLNIAHFDVNTAFLNGELSEKVYMQQPGGCIKDDKKVCLLQKAIYGLKQASRSWNEKVNEVLMTMSYQRSAFDTCLYYKDNFYIALYVDDFYVFYNDELKKNQLLESLGSNFKIKDLGKARQVLGMELTRENGALRLSLSKFTNKLLANFGLADCKPVKTPLELDLHTVLAEGEEGEELDHPNRLRYQSLIGALNYLSCNTRPDISAAVSFLSQYNSCCHQIHMRAAKRVLRYLKGTMDYSLIFKANGNLNITGYVDADWGGNVKDRKSFSGYTFQVGGNPVSWECKKQSCVALSSTEAEYIALSEACKEATYLQSFVASLLQTTMSPISLYVDNQSTIKLALNSVAHRRTKHVDIRFHYVRQCVENSTVALQYVPTEDNVADVLTKPLGRIKFEKCVSALGLT